jgi:hypothetical protein
MSDMIGLPARAALEAVREALDIPHAATLGDEETRTPILLERVMHTVIMLNGILDPDRGAYRRIEDDIAYLRERLAEHPATGYRTWAERMAELDAAEAQEGGAR